MGGRGELGASSPGSLPSLAPSALGLRVPCGGVFRSYAPAVPVRRASLASPSSRRGGGGLGAGEFQLLHPGLAASVCSRDLVLRSAFPLPRAEQRPGSPAHGQGLPPQDLAFQGALAQSLSSILTSPGQPPPRRPVSTAPRAPPRLGPALQNGAGSRAPRAPPGLARALRSCNRWSPEADRGSDSTRFPECRPRGPAPSAVLRGQMRSLDWPTRGLQCSHTVRSDPGEVGAVERQAGYLAGLSGPVLGQKRALRLLQTRVAPTCVTATLGPSGIEPLACGSEYGYIEEWTRRHLLTK